MPVPGPRVTTRTAGRRSSHHQLEMWDTHLHAKSTCASTGRANSVRPGPVRFITGKSIPVSCPHHPGYPQAAKLLVRPDHPARKAGVVTLLIRLALTFLLVAGALVVPSRALAQPAEPRFTWPLSPSPQVTRTFDAPANPYGPGHRGVDLAAAPGQQVLAAGPGVVVFAGQVAGVGVVSIDHDGGLRTTYEPMTPLVPVGAQVYRGQPVGMVNPGHPGCPVAACLHWGVRRGEEYLSPLALIQTESVVRLKPWDSPGDGAGATQGPPLAEPP